MPDGYVPYRSEVYSAAIEAYLRHLYRPSYGHPVPHLKREKKGARADAVALTCPRPAGWTAAKKITGKTFSLWWQTRPKTISVGVHFIVQIRTCGSPNVTRVRVRGWMPAHQHGMNYRPQIISSGRTILAIGLLFHMPGRWQLILDVGGWGKREKLIATMVLE